MKIHGATAALKNSTGHLTENAITFTPNSVLSDLGLSGKLVSKAIQPSQEQSPRSQSTGAMLSVLSHISTWVRLV
jgi:hypothetical protein